MSNILLIVAISKVYNIKGLYCDGTVALNEDMTHVEKSCVLAEEIGHHCTSSGDILGSDRHHESITGISSTILRIQSKNWLTGLIRAYEAGCRNIFEMAEYLDATEEYLKEALLCYKSKYGICTAVDNYIIYFEPFAVMKMIAVE